MVGALLLVEATTAPGNARQLEDALPLFGEIWTKYQVAQFSRVLGTLLVGGIPLVQALETAGRSLGTCC